MAGSLGLDDNADLETLFGQISLGLLGQGLGILPLPGDHHHQVFQPAVGGIRRDIERFVGARAAIVGQNGPFHRRIRGGRHGQDRPGRPIQDGAQPGGEAVWG